MTKDGVVTTYDYNSLNQITRAGDINYIWDNAGNLVSQTTTTGVLVASFTYDCRNRMISATVSDLSANVVETYEYDYLGHRTAKTSNGVRTDYVTDLSSGYSQILKAETDTSTVYYTRGFELISRREGTTASYYIYDGGLSVRALTNEAGTVTDTLTFDAFGNKTGHTGTTDNAYGFQGEEQDATGLYYLRARYMDPAIGTFTTMDTYGGSLSDPMSLHKYLFANSNPVRYSDPSGHFSLVEFELSEAIDEILMSSISFGMAYIGMVQDNQNLSETEKLAGYFAALGLGALFPFGVALLQAILPVLVAGLALAALSLALTLTSQFAVDHEKHPIAGALLDITAGAAWGASLSCLGSAFASNARKSSELIHIQREVNDSDYYVTQDGTVIPKEKYHSMSGHDVREWYLSQENRIPEMIDENQSIQEQAYKAFSFRNEIRTTARELMSDRVYAELLYETDNNLTWEEIINKQINKGLTGDDIYKAIIESSQRSRQSINIAVGMG